MIRENLLVAQKNRGLLICPALNALSIWIVVGICIAVNAPGTMRANDAVDKAMDENKHDSS